MQTIHVYSGKGVDGGALKQLIRSLQQETPCQIQRIDAKELIESSWEQNSSLFIMPGGRDIFYHQDLEGRGTDKIRSYVESGGNYLGICAGAYFASSHIEFEKGGNLEVCGSRSLQFFPGIAWGPAYGPNQYSYENTKGVKAARISSHLGEGHIYFNGGCAFNLNTSIEVMSRYLDLQTQPPAVIKRSFGKGLVILSGVHIEYRHCLLNTQDPYLLEVIPLLQAAEPVRKALFRSYLQSFNIPLN
jgi:glutamine amidotransferase-like uncharacterized protein